MGGRTEGTSPRWPLNELPAKDDIIVIASYGMRLWTVECRVSGFNGVIELTGVDEITLENLEGRRRVAFTMLKNHPVRGSGMVKIDRDAEGRSRLLLEPYRVTNGAETFELRLAGWQPMAKSLIPDKASFSFWYQAFRAVTLPLSALPVLVGGAFAFTRGEFNWPLFLLSLLGAVMIHAGANALADYFDFTRGVDLSTALSSHLGALARELVAPELVLIAALLCFLGALVIGIVLVKVVGWGLLLFGLLGLAGAFFYTGRPFSYKYRGMGELVLGFLMGPLMVMGAYYVQMRSWGWDVFLVSMGLAMLVSSISLANNLRDLPDDAAAGIRTLPMALGVSWTKKLYYMLTFGPYIISVSAVVINHDLWPIALVLVSLPQAWKTFWALRSASNDINDIRRGALTRPYPLNSIRLHLRFGMLAVAGVLLTGLLQLIWAI